MTYPGSVIRANGALRDEASLQFRLVDEISEDRIFWFRASQVVGAVFFNHNRLRPPSQPEKEINP
jgi:hypothetical protein